MPRRIEEYKFSPTTQGKYDFDTLLNGEIWQCFQGEDFQSEPASFAQTMYSAARRRGIRCRCRVQDDGSVVIQAYGHATPEVPASLNGSAQFAPPAPPAAPAASSEVSSTF